MTDMAKKKAEEKNINYAAEVKRLKEKGPERLYLLWGEERLADSISFFHYSMENNYRLLHTFRN